MLGQVCGTYKLKNKHFKQIQMFYLEIISNYMSEFKIFPLYMYSKSSWSFTNFISVFRSIRSQATICNNAVVPEYTNIIVIVIYSTND